MTITVYGSGLSPFTRKVLVFLEEKNVTYEHQPLSPFNAPDWFAGISPLGKIPVMRDSGVGGDATLPDSSVICAYLEKKHPEPALYPVDAFAYARALWYEEYADTALAEAVAGLFYNLIVLPRLGKAPDLAAVKEAREVKIPAVFAYLNGEIAGRDTLVGDALGAADIAVASQLANYAFAGETIDAVMYPNLAAYAGCMHRRPSFSPLIAAAKAALGG